jgi:hypothetical protein
LVLVDDGAAGRAEHVDVVVRVLLVQVGEVQPVGKGPGLAGQALDVAVELEITIVEIRRAEVRPDVGAIVVAPEIGTLGVDSLAGIEEGDEPGSLRLSDGA